MHESYPCAYPFHSSSIQLPPPSSSPREDCLCQTLFPHLSHLPFCMLSLCIPSLPPCNVGRMHCTVECSVKYTPHTLHTYADIALLCSALYCSAVRYVALRCSAVQCRTVQLSGIYNAPKSVISLPLLPSSRCLKYDFIAFNVFYPQYFFRKIVSFALSPSCALRPLRIDTISLRKRGLGN